jgi:hypothetical protein
MLDELSLALTFPRWRPGESTEMMGERQLLGSGSGHLLFHNGH